MCFILQYSLVVQTSIFGKKSRCLNWLNVDGVRCEPNF